MADKNQFGTVRSPQFGDRPAGNRAVDPTHCAECESMLADALDGILSPADQAAFDTHMALCGPCSQMLTDARRGAAWLELLRDPRPEPPAQLLERILAQTSGLHLAEHTLSAPAAGFQIAASAPLHAVPVSASFAKVLPFRARFNAALHTQAIRRVVLQPRLAMTAAMAFFSIALTLDLTGVRLRDLHARDLAPGSIQRDFAHAGARAVQYYEGLRVVYELESRVHDLQTSSDTETPAGTSPAQPSASPGKPSAQPSGPTRNQTDPDRTQPDAKKPAPSPGSSQREDLIETRRLTASTFTHDNLLNSSTVTSERSLA